MSLEVFDVCVCVYVCLSSILFFKVLPWKLERGMVEHKLQVESLKAGVKSLKAKIKTQKCKFKSTSYEFRIHELQVQLHELRVQIYGFNTTNCEFKSTNSRIIKSMKTQVSGLKSSSFPKIINPKLLGNS